MIPPTSDFRATMFTGLAFEPAGLLAWDVTFTFGRKGLFAGRRSRRSRRA